MDVVSYPCVRKRKRQDEERGDKERGWTMSTKTRVDATIKSEVCMCSYMWCGEMW